MRYPLYVILETTLLMSRRKLPDSGVSCVMPGSNWCIKKSNQHSEKMTEVIYLEVSEYLWWFQAELWRTKNHCKTAQNSWSYFVKNRRYLYTPNGWIHARQSKPWTNTAQNSDLCTKLQNILDEPFNPDRTNAVRCSDITYIRTIDEFVYLTCIMDLFSRKIIAWTLSKTLDVYCVIDTINKELISY